MSPTRNFKIRSTNLPRPSAPTARRRITAALLLGLFGGVNLAPFPLRANPSGGTVVSGTAGITQNGSTLNIANSNGAIINWQSFSIGAGETTRFLQPGAASSVLNRVVGGNLSTIFGTLQSNGQVFLINPNGVMVGAGGVVNTAGFTASTLDVSDAAFSQYANGGGQLQFLGASGAKVENLGTIRSDNGNIFLIAKQVNNSGVLSAPRGTVGLYASSEVYLTTGQADAGSVLVTAGALPGGVLDTGVSNTGMIRAVQAELKATGNMYALAVNNTGAIKAVGGTVGRNGVVHFTALGGTIQNSGTITARNGNGGGGEVKLQTGAGGTVMDNGVIDVAGKRPGTTGGTVELTGDGVAVYDHAVIDASGPAGGGTVLIGGDAHGANPDIYNAQDTYVGADAVVKADATDSGNGGKVVVWSNGDTAFEGSISARGGPHGGNGGWVETSGRNLSAQGMVTTLAPGGRAGSWLLDPNNLTIGTSDSNNTSGLLGGLLNDLFALLPGSDWSLSVSTLTTALGNGDVSIEANDIDITSALTSGSTHTLTMTGAAISVDATVNLAGAFVFDATSVYLNQKVTSPSLTGTALLVDVGASGSIQNAVDVSANGGVIELASATYTLTAPVLIQKSITLAGSGAANTILDGGHTTRVITIDGGTPLGAGASAAPTVSISGLTIQNGNDATNQGGGINSNEAILSLNNVTVQNNAGSGVYVNSYYFQQGAVTVNGTSTTITNSTITGNTAVSGAGISANAGGSGSHTLTVSSSTITGNTASNDGGGIGSYTSNGGGVSVSVTGGTLTGNTASYGGGISVAVGNGGGNSTTLTDVSVTGNTATGATGGDIYNSGGSLALSADGANGVVNLTAGEIEGSGPVSFTSTTGNIAFTQAVAGNTMGITVNAAGTISSTGSINVGSFELVHGTWQQIAASLPTFIAHNFILDTGTTFLRFLGGTGGTSTPYQIADVYGLQGAGSTGMSGNSYILANDIDASATQSWSGNFTPIADFGINNETFTGVFNGNGHVISNLTVNQTTNNNDAGLFGTIGTTGTVEHVGLMNVNVSMSGTYNAGALAGTNDGTVNGAYVTGTGTISGTNHVGGLVGANDGTVENSFSTIAVAGDTDVGGLVGQNFTSGQVQNSYATGTVTATTDVGGLVGIHSGGLVTTSFATGAVTGSTNVGGLIGNGSGGAVTNNYWDSQTAGAASGIGSSGNAGATPLTTAQMQVAANLTGFNFTLGAGIWGIHGTTSGGLVNGGLPYFQWQYPTISVTAADQTATYGSGIQTVAVPGTTYSDQIPTGSLGDYIGGPITLAQSGSNMNAGTTNMIVPTATVNSGYAVEFLNGTETITPATLTYTADGASRTYGASDPAFTGTVTGMMNGETLSEATTGTLSFITAATSGSNVGNYALTGSGLTANNGNYVFVQAAGNSSALTINPATLTYTADAASRTYGAANPALTGTVTGFVNGQTMGTATTGTLAFNTSATAASNVGNYAVDGSGLTANNGNYTFVEAAANSGALTINPATLTYTADAASRTYGAANPALTGTVTGFVNGQTMGTATTGTLAFNTSATAASNVGNYAVDGSGLTANNGNYTFVEAAANSGALTINPASITVALSGTASKVYDGTTSASLSSSNYLLTGVVNGDSLTLNGSFAYAGANVGTGINVAGAGLSLGGAGASNYTLLSSSASGAIGTITPASLILTATDQSKAALSIFTFGGTEFTASGLQNGETLQSATLSSSGTPFSASAGNYSIAISGGSGGNGFRSSNYNVSYVNGTLTVTPPPATTAAVLPVITTKISDATSQAAAATSAAAATLASDTSGSAGGTDKTVGSGSNGDPDTGSGTDAGNAGTGGGKKSATLGTTALAASGGGSTPPAHETVATSGAAGSIGLHGITVNMPAPSGVTQNFNKVLSPAVMSQLKQALQQ